MSGFSGAIKLADMNDYLSLNQSCIKPLPRPAAKNADGDATVAPPAASSSSSSTTSRSSVRVEFDIGSNDASDLRFPGLRSTGGAMGSLELITQAAAAAAPSGHFDQMKFDPIKKSASVSLNDCLACSGCVTSAETVLITQQSTQEFLQVLKDITNNKNNNQDDTTTSNDESQTSSSSSSSPSTTPQRKHVIVSISPQSLTAIAHEFQISPIVCAKKLTTFFLQLGCRTLVDTTPALDIALLEAQEEFVQRYRYNQSRLDGSIPPAATSSIISTVPSSLHSNTVTPSAASPLPILSSECPGWICYCEKTQGLETLSHVSSVRSGQAIMGAILKHWWCQQHDLTPEELFHTTIMPCHDKKLEGSRSDFFIEQYATRETDCVLSTGEIVELIRERVPDFTTLPETPLDKDLFNVNSDQAELYRSIDVGGSGGYSENLFRHASRVLFGRNIPSDEPLQYLPGRNPDFRELTLSIDGKNVLTFALAYGFRNIQNLVRKMKTKKASKIVGVAAESVQLQSNESASSPSPSSSSSPSSVTLPVGSGGYHFVEVMACPSGCLNGGGQVKAADIRSQKQLVQDLDTLYHQRQVCQPSENPIVKRIYREWLQAEQPGQGMAKQYLHTAYHAIEKDLANPLGIKW